MNLPKLHRTPMGAFFMLGKCLALCQVFEKTVARILTMYESLSGSPPKGKDIIAHYEEKMDSRLKRTLGPLVKEFKQVLPVSRLASVFDDALNARKWLVHYSVSENCQLLYSKTGELKFIDLVTDAYTRIYRALEILDTIDDALCERLGYTKEQRLQHYIQDVETFMRDQ